MTQIKAYNSTAHIDCVYIYIFYNIYIYIFLYIYKIIGKYKTRGNVGANARLEVHLKVYCLKCM